MKRILCRHPFDANKRVYVTPSRVQALHSCWFDGGLTKPFPSLRDLRRKVQDDLKHFREDHLRRLNPTPFKLAITSDLYTFMRDLLQREVRTQSALQRIRHHIG
jgi:nicotinate phosphoribosyltransferase